MKMTTGSIIGFVSLLTSVAARAAENSDFSIISLHSNMFSYMNFTRGETMLSLLGFSALAAVIAFRLWKAKQSATRT